MAPKDRFKPLLLIAATEEPATLRQAATAALKDIKVDIDRLNKDRNAIKDLVTRYGGSEDNLDSKGRTAKVREVVGEMAEQNRDSFSPKDVVDYLLETEGFQFAVQKPASMVGTVLSQLKDELGLDKLDDGRFRFKNGASGDGL